MEILQQSVSYRKQIHSWCDSLTLLNPISPRLGFTSASESAHCVSGLVIQWWAQMISTQGHWCPSSFCMQAEGTLIQPKYSQGTMRGAGLLYIRCRYDTPQRERLPACSGQLKSELQVQSRIIMRQLNGCFVLDLYFTTIRRHRIVVMVSKTQLDQSWILE